MSARLQHPVWAEDEFPIHAARLVERPAYVPPGSIEIRWLGEGGEHSLILAGNDADDFMERYRASPDSDAQELVLVHEIRKAAIP